MDLPTSRPPGCAAPDAPIPSRGAAPGGFTRLLRELVDDRRSRLALTLAMVVAVAVVRVASLGASALTDATEARYGEIARVMLATGNWVTPQEWPGHPFWAKPPLYAWVSAASMALLGVSEFAARLPSLLFAAASAWLVFGWARTAGAAGRPEAPLDRGVLAVGVLCSSLLFFVSAGAVMTDPALMFATTWTLAAFHHAAIDQARDAGWRWGFFIAAGLCMLAKGPVAVLYAGLPIAAWIAWTGQWRVAWQRLPWARGAVLFVAIWLPWYAAAEARTPGFLRYFLLGEHVLRFVEPGWTGDLYGGAHPQPLGTIWVFALAALGPWALCAAWMLADEIRRRRWHRMSRPEHRASAFLWLCVLAPLAAFSVARNLLWTYVLPVAGALATLVAAGLDQRMQVSPGWRVAFVSLLLASYGLLTVVWVAVLPRGIQSRTTAALVAAWRQEAADEPGPIRFWGTRPPASLRFYSRGEATPLGATERFDATDHVVYVVVEQRDLDAFRQWAAARQPARITETLMTNGHHALVEVEIGN